MITEWLKEKLCYKELEQAFEKALTFYGEKLKTLLLSSDLDLLLNDKKGRKALGTFCAESNEITLNQVKTLLNENRLDCVFVHELAHFIDHERQNKYSRYKFASSRHGTKERIIAELFRSKMKPVPQKRTNYRGRTCELFARAIEEFYGIYTKNQNWINEFSGWDYYVEIEVYKKEIYPIVKSYIDSLKG